MTEDKVEADEVSVAVKNRIEEHFEVENGEDLEDKVVNEAEVVTGFHCDVKGNDDAVANGVGEDECDNSYVLVNGSDLMVDDTVERGNLSEISVEVSDQEVLGEAGVIEEVECLDTGHQDESEEVDDTTESVIVKEVSVEVSDQEVLGESRVKEKEVDGLDREQKDECLKNDVSLVSDDVEESHVVDPDKDEMKMGVVEEIEKVDEEADQGEVVDTLQNEVTAEAEYSHKLEDVHFTTNGHESQHIICSGAVENGNANIGAPNSYAEELNSEIEIVESNESEHAEELEKESNDEYSLDKKENQDAEVLEELKRDCNAEYVDKNGTEDDAQVNLMELEQAGRISMIDDSLSGKVTAFLETHLSEEDHKFVIKSEVSSDVKDDGKCDSDTPAEELDFNMEEQNDSANILPVESNAEFKNADILNKHDDLLSSKISSANINDNDENSINSDFNLIQTEEFGAGNPTPVEQDETNDNNENNIDSDFNLIQTKEFGAGNPTPIEQDKNGLEYQSEVDEIDYKTAEAEQTVSKDIVVDLANQENKELVSEITDLLHSSLVTGCAKGSSINGNSHDLVNVVEVVELVADTGDSSAPNDIEWPELSYYTARRKISTVSVSEVHGTPFERETEEIHLPDQDRKEVHNGSPEEYDTTSYRKEVVDASLFEDSANGCADSGISKEINNAGESATWADCNDQIDGISSSSVPSTCSHSHFVSDGVVTAPYFENEVATSDSGSKDDETNLNGKLETSKVEISSEEDSSLTFMEREVDRWPFFFLVKVPRFEDDEIREQIKFAQEKVDEKTRLRDSYKVPIQTKKDICLDFNNELEAAKLKEKAVRDQLKAKRKEIDAVQAVIDKVNSAMTIEDIDGSIHAMEHKMQHETVPLSEEKQLMREIKRLRHFKEQLSSSIGTQEEIKEALDQKDEIQDHLKSLKRELNSIRSEVQSAEIVTKDAKKKCFDEYAELNKLQLEFKAADGVRQEAYMSLVSLRRELAQKNKFFRMYKDTERLANDYALSGNKKSLHSLCVNQVERVMELWNTSDHFRNDYIKCNARSTLRRLKTFDGRSLGLNEEPPSLPNLRNDRINHSEAVSNSLSHIPPTYELKIQAPSIPEKVANKPVMDSSENKLAKKLSKSTAAVNEVSTSPSLEITPVAEEEVRKTKEEEELAKKEEEIREREEEARMMEQLQMEERAKALEALERKKRMAERAEARAKLRAIKEAEQREKEREKRLRKKEKKKDGKEHGTDITAVTEPQPADAVNEATLVEKHVTKKLYKPSHYVKGTKTITMPINLRNRHKRKIQMWMWMCASILAAAVSAVLVWFGYLS